MTQREPVRDAEEAQSDRDFVARAARFGIVTAAVAAALFATLWVLKGALTPLVTAFVIAYLLDPLIDRLERLGLGRRFAILFVLALVGTAFAAFLLLVIPLLVEQLTNLVTAIPVYLERAQTELLPAFEARFGVELPNVEEVLAQLKSLDLTALGTAGDAVRQALTTVTGTLTGTVSALINALVIPILAYYLLVEFDDILARLAEWIPQRHREYVVDKARTADTLISGFLRGQLLVASILGVLYAVGFGFLGIDFAIGVGLLAGVMALVPYLGNVVALGSALALAILEFGFDWHVFGVIGWYVVVQNLEGFVLTPRIVGGSVGLHPAVVIVALLIGGDLFGFLGLLIAVPAAAVAKVFIDELLEAYRRSPLFLDRSGGPGPPPAPPAGPLGAPAASETGSPDYL
jgi:predicted PurR-regulated permease PerM